MHIISRAVIALVLLPTESFPCLDAKKLLPLAPFFFKTSNQIPFLNSQLKAYAFLKSTKQETEIPWFKNANFMPLLKCSQQKEFVSREVASLEQARQRVCDTCFGYIKDHLSLSAALSLIYLKGPAVKIDGENLINYFLQHQHEHDNFLELFDHCISQFIEGGVDPNEPDADGVLPIQKATILHANKTLKVLTVEGKVKPDKISSYLWKNNIPVKNPWRNHTPLIIALCAHYTDTVKMLLDLKVSLNKPTPNGDYPIHYVGDLASLSVLLDHKVNLNQTDCAGKTCLHDFLEWHKRDLAIAAVKNGARLDIRDKAGKLPTDYWPQSKEWLISPTPEGK